MIKLVRVFLYSEGSYCKQRFTDIDRFAYRGSNKICEQLGVRHVECQQLTPHNSKKSSRLPFCGQTVYMCWMRTDPVVERSRTCRVRCRPPAAGRRRWRPGWTRRARSSLRCRRAAGTASAAGRTAAGTGRWCTWCRTCTCDARAASRTPPETSRSGSTSTPVRVHLFHHEKAVSAVDDTRRKISPMSTSILLYWYINLSVCMWVSEWMSESVYLLQINSAPLRSTPHSESTSRECTGT